MKQEQKLCKHCQSPIVTPFELEVDGKTELFCCQGCLTVFEILNNHGLSEYYQLKEDTSEPINDSQSNYQYLDHDKFLEKYATISDETIELRFFIEGIHCVACLWLLERINEIIPNVLSSELNMAQSTLKVMITKAGSFSSVAQTLEKLGYKPHPLLSTEDIEKFQKLDEQKSLKRIGVAFACASNIMLLSWSVYSGAGPSFKPYFEKVSFLLSIPVLFYSAIPFYKSAFNSLASKKLSIDIPIVFSLWLGFFAGLYGLVYQKDFFYFDSITTLVFLLLFSRYLLKKSQQESLKKTELSSLYQFESIKKIDEQNNIQFITCEMLSPNDKVLVEAGEMIPVDGKVLQGKTYINTSLISGESLPELVNIGDSVFSGTQNVGQSIVISTQKIGDQTRLGNILKAVESGWSSQNSYTSFSESISKFFVPIVFCLGFFNFLFQFLYTKNLETAFTTTLSLFIITCPCALGLTIPLAISLGLSKFAKAGVLIKSEIIFEKIAMAKTILLDKTGTLTHGKFTVQKWDYKKSKESFIDSLAYSLEKSSQHPIALSIKNHLIEKYQNKTIDFLDLKEIKEIPGKGISAFYDQNFFEIKSHNDPNSSQTEVAIYKDDYIISTIELSDGLKKEAFGFIHTLKKFIPNIFIISGDTQNTVNTVAKKLEIALDNAHGKVGPQKKSEFVQKHHPCLMVGDGANDAVALSHASVGIAVKGSLEISLQAADVYISSKNINSINNLIVGSKRILKTIKTNLSISIVYNIAGVTLAILGHIGPLAAAILMPLSSISVLITTLLLTKKIGNKI